MHLQNPRSVGRGACAGEVACSTGSRTFALPEQRRVRLQGFDGAHADQVVQHFVLHRWFRREGGRELGCALQRNASGGLSALPWRGTRRTSLTHCTTVAWVESSRFSGRINARARPVDTLGPPAWAARARDAAVHFERPLPMLNRCCCCALSLPFSRFKVAISACILARKSGKGRGLSLRNYSFNCSAFRARPLTCMF